jgi:hypothetical protein
MKKLLPESQVFVSATPPSTSPAPRPPTRAPGVQQNAQNLLRAHAGKQNF